MQHDTRERLILAARELFGQKGYQGTSVAEILDRADANSGSLYHYFPTKQDLLLAVLEWYEANLQAQVIGPATQDVEDPVERVFGILDRYREALVVTDLAYGCPIGSLALEFKEPDPPVRELLSRNFTQWCQAVEACLDAGASRFPADLDRKELSQFILTTMEGGVMQARTHRSIETFDASVRQLRRYVQALQETIGPSGSDEANPSPEE